MARIDSDERLTFDGTEIGPGYCAGLVYLTCAPALELLQLRPSQARRLARLLLRLADKADAQCPEEQADDLAPRKPR